MFQKRVLNKPKWGAQGVVRGGGGKGHVHPGPLLRRHWSYVTFTAYIQKHKQYTENNLIRWAIATRFDLAQGCHQATIAKYIQHLHKILCDWVKIQVENYYSIRICSVFVQFRDDKHLWQYMEKYRESSSWL